MDKINSQTELYNKLKPALRTKRNEIMADGFKMVAIKDIWDFNKEYNWKEAKGLTLATMVDDILNTKNVDYENYIIEQYKINNRSDEDGGSL